MPLYWQTSMASSYAAQQQQLAALMAQQQFMAGAAATSSLHWASQFSRERGDDRSTPTIAQVGASSQGWPDSTPMGYSLGYSNAGISYTHVVLHNLSIVLRVQSVLYYIL